MKKRPYGSVKDLIAALRDPATLTVREFCDRHRLRYNSAYRTASRIGVKFKPMKDYPRGAKSPIA